MANHFQEIPNHTSSYNFTIKRIVNGFRFSEDLKGVYNTYVDFILKQRKNHIMSAYEDVYNKYLDLYPSLVA